jgi:hypothetical protein
VILIGAIWTLPLLVAEAGRIGLIVAIVWFGFGVLGLGALSLLMDRLARREASDFVREVYGHRVTIRNGHGTNIDSWKRAIDLAVVNRLS